MNNDTNEILGVSKLTNRCYHRRYEVYIDNNYNRYSYKAKRISINHPLLLPYKSQLSTILFTGSTHQKRGHGIQQIAKKNLERLDYKNLMVTLEDIFKL